MPTKISTYFGDITTLKIECIVIAVNAELSDGGGVDLTIHNAVGSKLFDACRNLRKHKFPDGLPEGEVVITKN